MAPRPLFPWAWNFSKNKQTKNKCTNVNSRSAELCLCCPNKIFETVWCKRNNKNYFHSFGSWEVLTSPVWRFSVPSWHFTVAAFQSGRMWFPPEEKGPGKVSFLRAFVSFRKKEPLWRKEFLRPYLCRPSHWRLSFSWNLGNAFNSQFSFVHKHQDSNTVQSVTRLEWTQAQ